MSQRNNTQRIPNGKAEFGQWRDHDQYSVLRRRLQAEKLAVVDKCTGDEKKHQVELLMARSGHELGSLAWLHTLSGTGEGTVLSSAAPAIRGSPTFHCGVGMRPAGGMQFNSPMRTPHASGLS